MSGAKTKGIGRGSYRPRAKNPKLCTVCGEPIARGRTHDRCKSSSVRGFCGMARALEVTIYTVRANLNRTVKHWSRDDGKGKLREMFPDMVGEVYGTGDRGAGSEANHTNIRSEEGAGGTTQESMDREV